MNEDSNNITIYSNRDPESWGEKAHRTWCILLSFCALCGVGAVILGVWLLMHALGMRAVQSSQAEPAVDAMSREEIGKVLQLFEARRALYDDLRTRPPAVGDPSGETAPKAKAR